MGEKDFLFPFDMWRKRDERMQILGAMYVREREGEKATMLFFGKGGTEENKHERRSRYQSRGQTFTCIRREDAIGLLCRFLNRRAFFSYFFLSFFFSIRH